MHIFTRNIHPKVHPPGIFLGFRTALERTAGGAFRLHLGDCGAMTACCGLISDGNAHLEQAQTT
jgi:hypothetical protein